MNVLPDVHAPRRRHSDGWRSYAPGVGIIAAAVALHIHGNLGEHVTTAVIGVGALRLPAGRLRDGKRWKLAEDSKTDEREARP